MGRVRRVRKSSPAPGGHDHCRIGIGISGGASCCARRFCAVLPLLCQLRLPQLVPHPHQIQPQPVRASAVAEVGPDIVAVVAFRVLDQEPAGGGKENKGDRKNKGGERAFLVRLFTQ